MRDRKNLNEVLKTVDTEKQVLDLYVYNIQTIYTEHWDESISDFVKIPFGDTFKIRGVVEWPEDSVDGRGIVKVEYFNGEIETKYADCFEVRR